MAESGQKDAMLSVTSTKKNGFSFQTLKALVPVCFMFISPADFIQAPLATGQMFVLLLWVWIGCESSAGLS